jgi:NADPH:quinone reductase-like Zn-dependent oxidoreductase
LVRALGAIPFGTARTPEKIEQARAIGLEDGVAVTGDLAIVSEAVGTWTAGKGMDVVLELVGGSYFAASLSALGSKGRLMLVGTLAGQKAEVDLSKILVKRLRVIGTVLRSRPLEEKIAATRPFEAEVVPLLANGVLEANVDRVFELEDIRSAHEYMESNASFGKIVIRV